MNTPAPELGTSLKIKATADHIGSLTNASVVGAISELIWNGFDASSTKVDISYACNHLEGVESIIVQDYGDGIPLEYATSYFSNIGNSWKKEKKKNYHHPLHGQNGKGRFKAYSLGAQIEWDTTFFDKSTQTFHQYSIIGNANHLDEFRVTDVKSPTKNQSTTRVTISNLYKKANEILKDKFCRDISKKFAVYLAESPHLSISINGQKINPKDFQINKKEYDLSDNFLEITDHPIILVIVEWSIDTDRKIHLCSPKGVIHAEYEPKNRIRAKGFNFTAYIKSEYFDELTDSSKDNSVQDLLAMDATVLDILDAAISKIQEHFRLRLASQNQSVVQEWKEEQIYPYKDDAVLTDIQKAEKDVFDIVAISVQNFLPNFQKTEKTSKKFMFKLIAQAISENPHSVQKIITEVLDLKKEEQDQLANLLENTTLSSIITSATIVSNRLNFLDGLEELLFGETKKTFTERDQLHKILEKEAWIFDEQFALSQSEETLNKVLEKHLSKLGQREDFDLNDPVLLPDGRQGRIDLMLSKVDQPRVGEFDYLVVELKRPTKKIDSEVLSQIEKYAIAVAEDERFLNKKVNWTFLAISNDLDSYAKRKSNQRNLPPGVVFQDGELNIKVIVRSWAEVIGNARAKLQFINDHLKYEVTHDSSRQYLKETHAEFIPQNNDQISA